jgi:hypothetical protein
MMKVVKIGDRIAIHSTPLMTLREMTKMPHHKTTSPKKFGCLLTFHKPAMNEEENAIPNSLYKHRQEWNSIEEIGKSGKAENQAATGETFIWIYFPLLLPEKFHSFHFLPEQEWYEGSLRARSFLPARNSRLETIWKLLISRHSNCLVVKQQNNVQFAEWKFLSSLDMLHDAQKIAADRKKGINLMNWIFLFVGVSEGKASQ